MPEERHCATQAKTIAEAAERLALDMLAARAEPRALKKQIEDLQRD
jgi:predicted RNase H-like HicB family nuclease